MAKKTGKSGPGPNAKSRGATGGKGRKSRGATGEQVQGVVLTTEQSDSEAVVELAGKYAEFTVATFVGLGIMPTKCDKDGIMGVINWLEDVATPGLFVADPPGELSGAGLAHAIRRLRILATSPATAGHIATDAAKAPDATGKASPHDKQAQQAAANLSASNDLEVKTVRGHTREQRMEISLNTIAEILETGEWPKGKWIMGELPVCDRITKALVKFVQANRKPDPNQPSLQLCNCSNGEQCPLGKLGTEHPCTVDELQNLCNMQAAALRDCEALIEKGFSVRIGDAWPALQPVMQNCRSAIAKCQAICKRQPLSVDRLSTLTEALRTVEQINQMLTKANISLIEIADMAAIPNMIKELLDVYAAMKSLETSLFAKGVVGPSNMSEWPQAIANLTKAGESNLVLAGYKNTIDSISQLYARHGITATGSALYEYVEQTLHSCESYREANQGLRRTISAFRAKYVHDGEAQAMLPRDGNEEEIEQSYSMIQTFAKQRGWNPDSAPGLIAWVMEQADAAANLRKALAVFHDIGNRIKPLLRTDAIDILGGTDLRLFDGSKYLFGLRMNQFDQAIEAYESTKPDAAKIPEDIAAQIQGAAKNISNRIHSAGCWAESFVADIMVEELARVYRAGQPDGQTHHIDTIIQIRQILKMDGYGVGTVLDYARSIMRQLDQAQSAVVDLQKAIGILGQPEALDRAKCIRHVREELAKFMGVQPHEVNAVTAHEWLRITCENAATVTEARGWLEDTLKLLGLDNGIDIVNAVKALQAKADDKDRERTADLSCYQRAMEMAVTMGMNPDVDHTLANWIYGVAKLSQQSARHMVRFQRSSWDNHRLRKALDRARAYINTHAGSLPPGLHRNIATHLLASIDDSISKLRKPVDQAPFDAGDRIMHFGCSGVVMVVDRCSIPENSPGLWFVEWHNEQAPSIQGRSRADECTLQQPKSVKANDLQPGPGRDS